jgi:hypothetical protein
LRRGFARRADNGGERCEGDQQSKHGEVLSGACPSCDSKNE